MCFRQAISTPLVECGNHPSKAAEMANNDKPIGIENVGKLDSIDALGSKHITLVIPPLHPAHGCDLEYTLSETVAYPNPYALPGLVHTIVSMSRLFLIRDITKFRQASASDEAFAAALVTMETHFDAYSAHCPRDRIRLPGPKVTRMPGTLSVGEYETLPQLMIVYWFEESRASATKWIDLVRVTKKLGKS